jgi:hypothetical protein
MTSSHLSSDGQHLTSNFNGIVPRKWATGIEVLVPEGQVCMFFPKNSTKFKRTVLTFKETPQPLVIKSVQPEMRMRENRVLGALYFFTLAPSPKIEWRYKTTEE